MSRSQLLEIAQKVYNSRDSVADRQEKKFSCSVIAALGETNKRGNGGNRPGEGGQGQHHLMGSESRSVGVQTKLTTKRPAHSSDHRGGV